MDEEPAEVPWSRVAAVLAINRLCAPGGELAIEERWYPSPALDDLSEIEEGKINDTRGRAPTSYRPRRMGARFGSAGSPNRRPNRNPCCTNSAWSYPSAFRSIANVVWTRRLSKLI
jgi:hypothetical protein